MIGRWLSRAERLPYSLAHSSGAGTAPHGFVRFLVREPEKGQIFVEVS